MMNAETKVIVDDIKDNREWWLEFLRTKKPIEPQIRDYICDSYYHADVNAPLMSLVLDKVDWDVVTRAITGSIHLRDAVPGIQYIVESSSVILCKAGDSVHRTICNDRIHIYVNGADWGISYYDEKLPDVYLVEVVMFLSSTEGRYTVVDGYDTDFEEGETVDVKCVNGETLITRTYDNVPKVKVKQDG